MATQSKNVEEAVVEAAEQAASEGKDFIKPSNWKADKDWDYLNEKAPDASHVLKAEMMNRFGPEGFHITPDQVKVFLAMHRWVQQSDANQSRGDFRGRTWESVTKGYVTLVKHAEERIQEEGPNAKMVPTPKAVTGIKASDILEAVAQSEEAPEEVKEEAAEVVKEVEEAKAEPAKKPAQRRQARTPRSKTPAKASS